MLGGSAPPCATSGHVMDPSGSLGTCGVHGKEKAVNPRGFYLWKSEAGQHHPTMDHSPWGQSPPGQLLAVTLLTELSVYMLGGIQ